MVENKEVWKKFDTYWKTTDWSDIRRKKVKKILGDSIDFIIPHNLTDPEIGEPFWEKVRKSVKLGIKDTDIMVCFEKVKDVTLGDLFSTHPIPSELMLKQLLALIEMHNLQTDKSKASAPKVDEPEVVDTSNEETDTEETEESVGE